MMHSNELSVWANRESNDRAKVSSLLKVAIITVK